MTNNTESSDKLQVIRDGLTQLSAKGIDTLSELANRVEDEAASQSLRDIARNIDNQSPYFKQAVRAHLQGNEPEALKNAYAAGVEGGGNTTRAILAGAIAGSFGGPLGSLLGALIAGSFVLVYELQDGRKLMAVSLTDEQVPAHATISDSSKEPLRSNNDLQYLLDEGFNPESEGGTLEQRLTRNVDFSKVTDTLDSIPYTETDRDDQYDGYYVHHNGQKIVILFGEDVEPNVNS